MKEEEEEEKTIHAKTISKIFKLVCGLGMAVCAILKWCNILPSASIAEIVTLWACIYGVCAGTIDLNIILDKVVNNGKI